MAQRKSKREPCAFPSCEHSATETVKHTLCGNTIARVCGVHKYDKDIGLSDFASGLIIDHIRNDCDVAVMIRNSRADSDDWSGLR